MKMAELLALLVYTLTLIYGCFSLEPLNWDSLINPVALRKAKIVYNFGLSE